MKRIAVEEHFATREYLEAARAIMRKQYPNRKVVEEESYLGIELKWLANDRTHTSAAGEVDTIENLLADCGEGRIKIMDQEGIDVQVLSSLSPSVQIFDPETATAFARGINDYLADKIKAHPDRFIGLATVAPQSPVDAANELERAVRDLGMRGVCIHSHTKGEYLDDKKFWPILETAEKLGVPLYIHPRTPSPAMFEPYYGSRDLTGPMLGFAAETSLHALRLIMSGAFDQFPNLKIILGHMGEAIPFWFWRLDNRWRAMPAGASLRKTPSEYFRNNFVVTTSGMFWDEVYRFVGRVHGVDNILFAVDYPFEPSWVGVQFLEQLDVDTQEKHKLSHLNAERVFGV